MALETVSIPVKSKDEIVDTVDVEVFVDYQEAVDFFATPEKSGEDYTLEMINRAHKTNKCNVARAGATQTAKSAMNAIRNAAKNSPKAAAKVQQLLDDLGLTNVKI